MNDLLLIYPPPILQIVEGLRQLIQRLAPDVKVKGNHGKRSRSYHDPLVGYACGIFPLEDHIDLVFELGALLQGPGDISMRDTLQARCLRFHEPGDIDNPTIMNFLQAA